MAGWRIVPLGRWKGSPQAFRQWPEWKADAMHEAAFCYHDLKNLEIELSSFPGNPHQPTAIALKRMLETSVHNINRIRESSIKRYKEFQIPWEWMLDTRIISQLKLCSMRLAKCYMKWVTRGLKSIECTQENGLMLQRVWFAFPVHQFVGGFNVESMQPFQEMRNVGMGYQKEFHK